MPTTDWQLVRHLLAAAVDACEAAERLRLTAEGRGLSTGAGPVDVGDVLASAWTYPENVRYAVVRARHALGTDAPFQPEAARALREVGARCAELVGAGAVTDASLPASGGSARSLRAQVEALAAWYRDAMVPQLTQAADGRAAA